MVATLLAALLLAAYLVVNALDLGIGLLLTLVARGCDRDAVLGGGGRPWLTCASSATAVLALLLAGLPESLRPLRTLWPVLLALLAALLVRAAAAAARRHVLRQDLADLAFGLASLLATLCQGAALGWVLGDLGAGPQARHAAALGWASTWGLLGAVALVGLHALIGSAWLIWAGRDAVQVFGREVARTAALGFGAATTLCALGALATGVETPIFARDRAWGAGATALALAALGMLAAFHLTRWSARAAVPAACGLLAGALALAALLVAVFPFAPTAEVARDSFASYLVILLLLGGPAVAADALSRGRALRAAAPDDVAPSHAGRRSGSLANSLHLS